VNGFSLRLRLMAAAAAAILIALLIAGAGMSWLFERHIEQREAEALIRDAETLAANLRLDPAGRPLVESQPADERYGKAASGRYWQVVALRGAAHSESLWDQNLGVAPGVRLDRWRVRHLAGPFGKSLILAERPIVLDRDGPPILVQVASDDAPLETARSDFAREIALSLALLWLVLLVAAYAQVSLGLRPLVQVRKQIAALRRNPAARLPSGHPREIAPLIEAVNALAAAREADLARARRRAGDLAHSLTTPLAAMAAQSRRARAQGANEAADGLDRAIAAMRTTLETELARARAAALRDSGGSDAVDIESLIDRIVAVIERTEAGERIIFEVEVEPDSRAPVAPETLMELLGALVENAARQARRRVRILGRMAAGESLVSIEDDGPGLDSETIEAVVARGCRLDEAGPGHGLGLAIVRDLMEATGGTLTLGPAPLGGLEARLAWPVDSVAEPVRRSSFLRRLTRR
jgi:signal transduction histidine kinase